MHKDLEIVGVDHGFRNMKTSHVFFTNRLGRLKNQPDDKEGILEVDDSIYSIYGPELSTVLNKDKTVDESFYLLTLAALARELSYRQVSGNVKVRLAVGLPQKWYETQKDAFKEYLLRKRNITFSFEGRIYYIMLDGVSIFPQGYAAMFACESYHKYLSGYCTIVDIGGETMDLIVVDDGRIIQEDSKIDTRATIWLINSIKERIETEFYESIPTKLILEMMKRDKSYECGNRYEELIKQELVTYTELVYKRLKEFRINTDITQLVFVGGGAIIMKNYSRFAESINAEFITDICANAKGFEEMEKLKRS